MYANPRRIPTLAERLTVEGVIRCWPHTAEVFGRYRIDTRAGGASIAEAASQGRVDLDALLSEIFDRMWQGS